MGLTDSEFGAILEDATKRVRGDVTWNLDVAHAPALQFRTGVESAGGWPLFVAGWYKPVETHALSYALVLKGVGRIYGLDLGKVHRNPAGEEVGEKHKHRWTEQHRDQVAYVPADVKAPVSSPVAVWREFCAEARIRHDGLMKPPPENEGGY